MKKTILGAFVTLLSFQGVGANINQISVFVAQSQIKNVVGCDDNCQIFELDATDNLLNDYFGDLPDNEDEAYEVVMDKINSPQWKAYEKRIVDSQSIVVKAFELGIKKYPAIVINETDVSYGTFDVSKAVSDYLRSQADDNN